MRPYIDTMRENIAKALKIDVNCVNVKATTEEGLGFTGTGEGISSQAICSLVSVSNYIYGDSDMTAAAVMDVLQEEHRSKSGHRITIE